MPKPTPEQLERINRFTMKEFTEDEIFVFPDLLIDDQATAYSSKLHENLLRKFVKDANKGVGLLMNHNSWSLPVGRSFQAELREDYNEETGETMKTVYGQFYIDLGRNTESGMTTDDLVKGIEAGTIFDTSVGFNANKWDCSICSNDIRDWRTCSHIPGRKYAVEDENGNDKVETCYVIVGADGGGELLENSLVYAGACDRATIKGNFSRDVKENEKGTKLHLVENFKNIPVDATIYQYYTKDGSVLFTDTEERTNGAQELKKRSELEVELKQILSKFNLNVDNAEELSKSLETLVNAQTELSTANEKVESLTKELADTSVKLEEANNQLTAKDGTISELTATNEELTKKAELANTYRQELEEKALELGVRAQGNAFNREMYSKFLSTLSIEEVKEVINGFDAEVKTRFAGARVSEPGAQEGEVKPNRLSTGEPKSKADFESDEQFREFVADKAVTYAKENGVSIGEATKAVYKQFSKEDGGAE